MNNHVNELLASGQKIVWFVAGIFLCGALLQPYIDLPDRVRVNEDSIRSIEGRLQNSERKLDQVICMLDAMSQDEPTIGCAR